MKIMVTGAAGYIGSHVVSEAISRGHQVVGFDSLDNTLYSSEEKTHRLNALKKYGDVEISVFNPARDDMGKLPLEEIDVVINEMAVPGLAPSWSHFEAYVESNVIALEKLLKAIALRNPSIRFVQASTSSVYGNTDGTKRLRPISPYGVSKLAAENLLSAYETHHGLEVAILRYFSVYGGLQRPDMAYGKFIKSILLDRKITIFGDGSQVRTNTHVTDIARATLDTAESKKRVFTIDISGNQEVSLIDALRLIEKSIGKEAKLEFSSTQPGDQQFTKGDLAPAMEKIGWKPTVSFEAGIRDQITQTKLFLNES